MPPGYMTRLINIRLKEQFNKMNTKLINAWVDYLMGQCGISETICPRKGCPMESCEECKFAQEEVKRILAEHDVMNIALNAINELKENRQTTLKR